MANGGIPGYSVFWATPQVFPQVRTFYHRGKTSLCFFSQILFTVLRKLQRPEGFFFAIDPKEPRKTFSLSALNRWHSKIV